MLKSQQNKFALLSLFINFLSIFIMFCSILSYIAYISNTKYFMNNLVKINGITDNYVYTVTYDKKYFLNLEIDYILNGENATNYFCTLSSYTDVQIALNVPQAHYPKGFTNVYYLDKINNNVYSKNKYDELISRCSNADPHIFYFKVSLSLLCIGSPFVFIAFVMNTLLCSQCVRNMKNKRINNINKENQYINIIDSNENSEYSEEYSSDEE